MKNNCIAVPVSALETYDYSVPPMAEKEASPKSIAPRVGDPVDFHVKGSIESIDGKVAQVRLAFVNNKRVGEEAAAKPENSEEDDLQAMAAQADEQE